MFSLPADNFTKRTARTERGMMRKPVQVQDYEKDED
jgi:hypothetical protein